MRTTPRTLMQNLYYPALVGTGLTLTLYKAGSYGFPDALTSIDICFGLLLVWYFSLSFLANARLKISYNWILFCIDLFEIVAIFAAYFFLGFFDKYGEMNELGFYIAIIFPPILHNAWNHFVGYRVRRIIRIVNLIRILLISIGILWGHTQPGFSVLLFFGLLILTIWYCILKYRKVKS